MKKRGYIILAVLALTYLLSYLLYRNTHVEVWDKNHQAYVIFPKNQKWIYYLYRPLSYVDGRVTGMGFHIGPHQD